MKKVRLKFEHVIFRDKNRLGYIFILLILVVAGICYVSCSCKTIGIINKGNDSNVTVALDWYINPDHGPLLVAQAMGFFKKNGVNVSFIASTETSAPSQLVCAEKADVALLYEPQLIAQLAGGMPLVCAGTFINKILCCIAVLKDSRIKKISELRNKTIGYSNGGTGHTILGAMLDYNGVKLKEVKLVNLQMNLSQALLSKRVDAVYSMMRNVEPIQLKGQGIETKLFYPEDNGVPMYNELMLAVKKTHGNDKKIINFLKGVKQGINYINKNPEKAWGIISEKYKDSLAMTFKMKKINHDIWNDTIKYFATNPETFNKKQFNVLAEFLCQKGAISKINLKKIQL
jgi:putative hydroxymethylpyrimidine transport system substrate-binding protein